MVNNGAVVALVTVPRAGKRKAHGTAHAWRQSNIVAATVLGATRFSLLRAALGLVLELSGASRPHRAHNPAGVDGTIEAAFPNPQQLILAGRRLRRDADAACATATLSYPDPELGQLLSPAERQRRWGFAALSTSRRSFQNRSANRQVVSSTLPNDQEGPTHAPDPAGIFNQLLKFAK